MVFGRRRPFGRITISLAALVGSIAVTLCLHAAKASGGEQYRAPEGFDLQMCYNLSVESAKTNLHRDLYPPAHPLSHPQYTPYFAFLAVISTAALLERFVLADYTYLDMMLAINTLANVRNYYLFVSQDPQFQKRFGPVARSLKLWFQQKARHLLRWDYDPRPEKTRALLSPVTINEIKQLISLLDAGVLGTLQGIGKMPPGIDPEKEKEFWQTILASTREDIIAALGWAGNKKQN